MNVTVMSSNVRKLKFCHRKLKFETLIDNGIFYRNFKFGVNWCTFCHVTQQNVNLTKIMFFQSVLKIETLG